MSKLIEDGDELLTTKQAAEILTVGPSTLSQWRYKKNYDLPYLMIGSSVRYRKSDVLKFLKKGFVSGILHGEKK